MNTRVLLPLETPIVTSWANQSHVFAIAQRHPGYKNWMFTKFLQLELIQGLSGGHHVLNYSHLTTPEEECPWIDITRTTVQEIETNGDLISFFKKTLSEGAYIYQFVNQFYIPQYPFY